MEYLGKKSLEPIIHRLKNYQSQFLDFLPPYPFAEIEKDQKGESFLAYSNEAGRNDLTVIYNKAGKQENIGGNNLKKGTTYSGSINKTL